MKLHLDHPAFRTMISRIHEKTGYREDVLEKDYYVTLILQELASFQREGLPAYFKGGTALYKVLKRARRFSEDIDISVETKGCSRSQGDRRMHRATKEYHCLSRENGKGVSNRSEVITFYDYKPITSFDESDALQRFGKIKIEATSFTISEPFEEMEICSLLYVFADETDKTILSSTYDENPFSIKAMTLERIFVDKLFAAEAYTRRSDEPHRAFEAAKHIYDLAVLFAEPKIRALLDDSSHFNRLLHILMEEEKARLDGIPLVSPRDFLFFLEAPKKKEIETAYRRMQSQYVFNEEDEVPFSAAAKTLRELYDLLQVNPVWMKASPDA